MRNPQGYALITNPEDSFVVLEKGERPDFIRSGIAEYDTFSCGHCNKVKHVRPKERPEDLGGLCKTCMKLICPVCVNEMRCTPLEKKIEEQERRDYLRLSYGI